MPIWSRVGWARPPICTITSPGWSPACTAGDVAPSSFGVTATIPGMFQFAANMKTAAKISHATRKCDIGPAKITMIRCHTGFAP